jgi:lactoylglutathione lyase
VILDVGDLERSLAFYHGLLRLPVQKREDLDGHRLAHLGTGSAEILLLQQPKEDQNPALERSGGLVMKFYVRDLRGVAEDLRGGQVRVLRELDLAALGEHTLLVADPDGYAVLLAEPAETVH